MSLVMESGLTNFLEKLSFCAAHIEETGEDVMLIDDSYEQLLDRIDQLEASQKELLRQHFTLLAFGAQEAPPERYESWLAQLLIQHLLKPADV
jgi:hypothetical protein